MDQSDWPITSSDTDAGGNYTSHRGFEIQGGVCFDPASQSWKFRVSRLVWRGKINTSLNSGFLSTEPVVGPVGNVVVGNYCAIIDEMAGYLGRGRGSWHLRAASLAHEVHHRDVDWPAILGPLWQNIETAIEAESVPCDRDAAEAELILGARVAQHQTSLQTQFVDGVSAFNVGHDGARTDGAYQAGQAVLDGRITEIRNHATAEGWTPCPPFFLARQLAGLAAPGGATLVRLDVTAPATTLSPGQTTQLRVVGIYSDGTQVDLTTAPLIVYQSPRPDVATLNNGGQVAAVAPGVANLVVSHALGIDGHPIFGALRISVPAPHDLDDDGMPDDWERAHGLNPNDPRDALLDTDGDGLRNLKEYELGTHPRNRDTDGDGRSDFQETLDGTDPLTPDTRNRPPSLGLHYFALMNLETGLIEQRGLTGRNGEGHESLIMAPNTRYRQWVFHPASGRVGTADWISADTGRRFQLPAVIMRRDRSVDSDDDGLRDTAELILGTNKLKWDTDGDGISDGAEVRAGTNPLDGLPVATGVIASADTPGNAVDVAARSSFAAVADSQAGVAIFNIESGFTPTLVAQVDTPGNARAVALLEFPTSRDVLRVAVADGPAGLAVIDLELPDNARLTQQVNLGGNATCVTVLGGLAYVGLESGRLVVVDTSTGTILERLDVRERINDVGIRGDVLLVAGQSRLYAYSLAALSEAPLSSVPLGFFPEGLTQRRRLFVGGLYGMVTSYPGYDVIDLRDPARLQRLGQATDGTVNSFKHIVDNGSGLGVAAVGVNPRNDGTQHVSLYDVSNPNQTTRFLLTLPTPGIAHAISLYNGLAYVADGAAGLQVVNYLAYDSGNQPPSITLSADFPLAPPQAEEGKLVEVAAEVSDDVQVARVEFYVNGNRLGTDGNYPFTQQFVTPLLNQGTANNRFTLRARAFDTGGNSAWSTEYVVQLVPDATPPRVIRRFPAAGAIVGSTDSVAAYFSEPVDTATLTTATVRLFAAGADGVLGTADDVPLTDFTADYRSSLNALFLPFPAPLAPGLYQAQIRPPLADLAGNPLPAPVIWNFWVLGQEDRDNDGVPDNVEEALGLDPDNPDTNGNGILDGDEDPDRDGLRTRWELLFGYDPRLADTDGNGIRDSDEDPDGDGLKNSDEQRYGTHPLLGDSDGDGWDDLGEVLEGTDPANGLSQPQVLVASVSASFLNAVPDGAPAGTPLLLTSPVASYLNAVADTVPAATPIQIVSPAASYLNAVAETLAADTPIQLLSPVVSYLNAEPETTPDRWSVSPVVSYHNQ